MHTKHSLTQSFPRFINKQAMGIFNVRIQIYVHQRTHTNGYCTGAGFSICAGFTFPSTLEQHRERSILVKWTWQVAHPSY